MRGKLFTPVLMFPLLRITPADAGKTVATATAHDNEWDHPRGCGENRLEQVAASDLRGSPPRMRGKLVVLPYRDSVNGITPADAGKTTVYRAT